jgi:hypothetical protein
MLWGRPHKLRNNLGNLQESTETLSQSEAWKYHITRVNSLLQIFRESIFIFQGSCSVWWLILLLANIIVATRRFELSITSKVWFWSLCKLARKWWILYSQIRSSRDAPISKSWHRIGHIIRRHCCRFRSGGHDMRNLARGKWVESGRHRKISSFAHCGSSGRH